MPRLPLLCAALLLCVSSDAQQPDLPAQQGAEVPGEAPPPAVAADNPPETAPVPNVPSPPETAAAPNIPSPPETAAAPEVRPQETPVLAGSTPVAEVITPKIAFKLSEGGSAPKSELLGESGTKILGAKCTTNQDCISLNHTQCNDGMCLCSAGYIPSKRKLDVCLKVPSGLGDRCEEEHQCGHAVNGSECINNKCSCPPNNVFSKNRCWEKQMLGGKCNITEQCSDTTFAVCLQGVCTCEDPMIPSPINKCLAPAGTLYKALCVEDIQCSYSFGDQGHCAGGECVCTVNHHFNGTKCVLDKKLGEACLSDSDCKVSDTSNTEGSRSCVGNACTCATGFSSLPGEDFCTRSSGEELAVSLTWVLCIVLAKYYLA